MEYENDMEDLIQNDSDFSRIPPDIGRAELHKVTDFYTLESIFILQKSLFGVTQMSLLRFYTGHLKYTFCADLSIYSDCNGPMFYFSIIKWMILQLFLIRIFFIIVFIKKTEQGNYCEEHPNCDPNSSKIESIWNYAPNYASLKFGQNGGIDYFFAITISILIIGNYFWLKKQTTVDLQVLILKLGYQILRNTKNNTYSGSILTPMVLKVLQIQSGNYYINTSYDFEKYEDLLFQKSQQFYFNENDPKKRKQKLIRKILYDQILIQKCVKKITLIFFNKYAAQDFFKVCPTNCIDEEKQDQTLKMLKRFFSSNFTAITISYLAMIVIRAISLLYKQSVAYIENEDYNKNWLYAPKAIYTGLQFGVFWFFEKIAKKFIYKRYFFFYNIYLIVVLVLLPFGQGGWDDIYKIHVTTTQQIMLEEGGALDNIISASQFIFLFPLLMWIFQVKRLWAYIKLCYKRLYKLQNLTQIELNLLYEKNEMNLFEKRMTIYKYYLFALAYYLYYPMIIQITLTGFVVIYIVDKFTLVKDSAPIKRDILDDYVTVLQSFSVQFFSVISLFQILSFYVVQDIILAVIVVIICLVIAYKLLRKNTYVITETLDEGDLRKILSTQLETLSYDQGFNPQNGKYFIPNQQKLQLYKNIEKRLQKQFQQNSIEKNTKVNVSDSGEN